MLIHPLHRFVKSFGNLDGTEDGHISHLLLSYEIHSDLAGQYTQCPTCSEWKSIQYCGHFPVIIFHAERHHAAIIPEYR